MNRGTLAFLIPILAACGGGYYQQPTPAMQKVAEYERQQAAAYQPSPEQQREKYCKGLMGAAMMQPTLTGRMGESFANANAAYASCMAGLPPPETPLQKQQRTTTHTTCKQGMMGEIKCTSY